LAISIFPSPQTASTPSHIKAEIAKKLNAIEVFDCSLNWACSVAERAEIASSDEEEVELKENPDLLILLLKTLSMIVVARVPPKEMERDISETMDAICVGK